MLGANPVRMRMPTSYSLKPTAWDRGMTKIKLTKPEDIDCTGIN